MNVERSPERLFDDSKFEIVGATLQHLDGCALLAHYRGFGAVKDDCKTCFCIEIVVPSCGKLPPPRFVPCAFLFLYVRFYAYICLLAMGSPTALSEVECLEQSFQVRQCRQSCGSTNIAPPVNKATIMDEAAKYIEILGLCVKELKMEPYT